MTNEELFKKLDKIIDFFEMPEEEIPLYSQWAADVLHETIARIEELSEGRREWISVNDALPTEEGQDCWVWCKEMGEPELDNWDGGRGEKAIAILGDDKRVEFIKNGWYYNDMQPITYWMPIDEPIIPEPPKEEMEDA